MNKLKLISFKQPTFVQHAMCDMIHNVLYHAIFTFIIYYLIVIYMFYITLEEHAHNM